MMGIYDIAVIGAGPAGMTAALYAARAGYTVGLFESMTPGGQMAETDRLDNYPGYPEGISGFELAQQMHKQALAFDVEYVNETVVDFDLSGDMKAIVTSAGTHNARAVIVATGASSRKLGVPGEAELAGRGVSYCATCDGNFFRGKTAVVVGGGNTAAADAVYLSNICEKVYVVHRRDALRATKASQDQLEAAANIEFVWNAEVKQINADDNGVVGSVTVADVATGEERGIPTSCVFVAVGKVPNTAGLGGLPLDQAGYVIADEQGATEVAGLFAAGDVRTKRLRQVATAVGDGANAAEMAAEYLASLL